MTTEKTPATSPEDAKPCIRCGYRADGDAKPNEEDRKEYLRCLLGGKLYQKTFPLYDGQFSITFRQTSNREVETINGLLFKLASAEKNYAFAEDISLKLKMMIGLVELKTSNGPLGKVGAVELDLTKDCDTLVAEVNRMYAERFGALPEAVSHLMGRTFVMFNDIQTLLIRSGFDEDFWKGAGLR